jgi:hypothetical protein
MQRPVSQLILVRTPVISRIAYGALCPPLTPLSVHKRRHPSWRSREPPIWCAPSTETEPMTHNILEDLKNWLARLIAERERRKGEYLEDDIELVRRAIAEITRLRLTVPN